MRAVRLRSSTMNREGLSKLLSRPLSRGKGGAVEVHNPPPIVSQDQEQVESLEPDRGHGEVVQAP